jgi:hypothetical protein
MTPILERIRDLAAEFQELTGRQPRRVEVYGNEYLRRLCEELEAAGYGNSLEKFEGLNIGLVETSGDLGIVISSFNEP